jgi:hypothetical protein
MRKIILICTIFLASCRKTIEQFPSDIQEPKVVGSLNVSPIPTSGPVTFSFNLNPSDKYSLQVIDINGKVIKSYGVNSLSGQLIKTDDYSQLINGTYDIILVNMNGSEYKTPLIIKK